MTTTSTERLLLQALHAAEQGAAEGLPADRAVARAVAVYHVDPGEVRQLWLAKLVERDRAQSWLEAE